MEYSKHQINEVFKKLPDPLKDAIVSVENADKLEEIGNKYRLDFEQKKVLGSETGLIMLGLVKAADFADHLATRMNIDHEVALSIAGEVSQQLFIPILDLLKKLNPGSILPTETTEKNDVMANNWHTQNKDTEVPPPQQATIPPQPPTPPAPEPVPTPEPKISTIPFKKVVTPERQNVTMRSTDYIVRPEAYNTMGKNWRKVDDLPPPEEKNAAEVEQTLKQTMEEPKVSHAANVREILSHAHILRAIEEPETIPSNYEEVHTPHAEPEIEEEHHEAVVSGVPEIAPEHELMIEPWEKAHNNPIVGASKEATTTQAPLPSSTPQKNSFTLVRPRVNPQSFAAPEPRITTPVPPPPTPEAPIDVPKPPYPHEEKSKGFIDQMLHGFVSIKREEKTASDVPLPPPSEQSGTYKVDPYREAI